jgi:Leucine-rich repeat (LRR) protein
VKQHLRIKELNIGMTMLSRKGLRSLKDMDTSTLQKLFLKSLSIESATLKQIFLAKEFSNLQELSLTGNK